MGKMLGSPILVYKSFREILICPCWWRRDHAWFSVGKGHLMWQYVDCCVDQPTKNGLLCLADVPQLDVWPIYIYYHLLSIYYLWFMSDFPKHGGNSQRQFPERKGMVFFLISMLSMAGRLSIYVKILRGLPKIQRCAFSLGKNQGQGQLNMVSQQDHLEAIKAGVTWVCVLNEKMGVKRVISIIS
jgi:hypothetical protein